MEKPTGVIQKIIESLQQVNALDTYSPIEKDIILHNLRAAYMIFLNLKVEEQSAENRVEKRFEIESRDAENQDFDDKSEEVEIEEVEMEEEIEEEVENEEMEMEEEIEEEIEEEVENEVEAVREECEKESYEIEEKPEESPVQESLFSKPFLVEEPQNIVLQDDLLEFIPDAKPQSHFLFEDLEMPKIEKKSLNDLLTEKKDDNSLGTKFQQSFIPDLTKAIAINEKFSFIRELFHNSGVDFSNSIQKLNECENIDDAFILMEELKHQYLWDTTSSAYLSLCDLVRRRFI